MLCPLILVTLSVRGPENNRNRGQEGQREAAMATGQWCRGQTDKYLWHSRRTGVPVTNAQTESHGRALFLVVLRATFPR